MRQNGNDKHEMIRMLEKKMLAQAIPTNTRCSCLPRPARPRYCSLGCGEGGEGERGENADL